MIVQVEARCWQYAHCEQEEGSPSRTWGSWRPLPPMPQGLSGGGSVSGGEQLWAVGGGDGETASGAVQILHLNSSSGSWEWTEGPSLTRPRYGHCVVQVMVGWRECRWRRGRCWWLGAMMTRVLWTMWS